MQRRMEIQTFKEKTVESTALKVNNVEITAKQFAWDGCHKIYLINSEDDRKAAHSGGYTLYTIAELQEVYESSCGLRYISNWDLTGYIVEQFEDAVFEGFAQECKGL
jgi:hypothetical protein